METTSLSAHLEARGEVLRRSRARRQVAVNYARGGQVAGLPLVLGRYAVLGKFPRWM